MPRHDELPPRDPTPSTALDASECVEVAAGVFKNTCLALMDEVRDQRKQVVITKHGDPVAKLVPPDTDLPSAFGFLRGTLLAYDDIVSPDPEAWGDLA
jgi:prevent-host-death family protein